MTSRQKHRKVELYAMGHVLADSQMLDAEMCRENVCIMFYIDEMMAINLVDLALHLAHLEKWNHYCVSLLNKGSLPPIYNIL